MTSTIELSLYPLQHDYPSVVLHFLKQLKTIPDIEIQTNGMSTILIGEYEQLWTQLGILMKQEMTSGSSIFVMKVVTGRREFVSA
jgi:uncharacterized protein YqgV (UPF0045/DUF77 family)